jgi:2-keto-4-pentenoate hydratase/2-oxohepta-3-ene-1,7-dioic acid hydratase in catechol pathway
MYLLLFCIQIKVCDPCLLVNVASFSCYMYQSAGLPWTVAKGQDTFTPISSVVRNELYFFYASTSAEIVLYWIVNSFHRSNRCSEQTHR